MGWKGEPKTKRTNALKTPAAKMTRRQAAEDRNNECDDDALKKDVWQHSHSTMIRIEPFSTASAAGAPQEGFFYCEIRHSSPIQYCVRGGRADALVCQRPAWVRFPPLDDWEEGKRTFLLWFLTSSVLCTKHF